jgi:Flp pilus assembly protein TadG
MRGRRGVGTAKGLNKRGQALAEFALVMPLVLLFIAGIVEMGRAWNIKQVVTDAAREGARYSVVQDASVDSNAVKAKIMERLALANIETASITIAPAANWRKSGQAMTVTVSTNFRMGLIGALLKWTGTSPTVPISTEATMRNEPGT